MEIIKRIILYPIKLSFKLLIMPVLITRLIIYLAKRKGSLMTLSVGEIFIKLNESKEMCKIVLGLTFHLLTLGIFVKVDKK